MDNKFNIFLNRKKLLSFSDAKLEEYLSDFERMLAILTVYFSEHELTNGSVVNAFYDDLYDLIEFIADILSSRNN